MSERMGLWFCPNRECSSRKITLEESLVELPYEGLPSEGVTATVTCSDCSTPLWLVQIKEVMPEDVKAALRERLAALRKSTRERETAELTSESAHPTSTRVPLPRIGDAGQMRGYGCRCGFYTPIEDKPGNRGPLLSSARARWRKHTCDEVAT